LTIGDWYQDFSQVPDADVTGLLCQAGTCPGPRDAAPDPAEVAVDAGGVRLSGSLAVPPGADGLVVFVHGSGGSRHSPRNQFVAAGLLTPDEELSRANVFNVALLAARLAAITRWLCDQPGTATVPLGYFGASTGTAAALAAATATPRLPVTAIASRGGRPDLVGGRLALVRAPTLLIVGGADTVVPDLNQRARAQLKCESRLAVVPGATHLFPEPGALGQVTDLAADWFGRHFARADAIAAAA